jgi:hypothetical protein
VENTAKIILFEKKTFFNFCSIFVKKKPVGKSLVKDSARLPLVIFSGAKRRKLFFTRTISAEEGYTIRSKYVTAGKILKICSLARSV